MLCPKHHSWKPETGRYGLPSHLILAFFYSLYSCLESCADFCRCIRMFYGFITFILQLQWYPPPAQITWEVGPSECKTQVVPPAMCLVGVLSPSFEGWGKEQEEGCLDGQELPFFCQDLSRLLSTFCRLNSKTRDISNEQNIQPTKE